MNSKLILALIVGAVLLVGGSCIGSAIGTANEESVLRNQLEATQRNLPNEYDNAWKTVAQTAQVDAAYSKDIKDAYLAVVQGRTSDSGLLFKALSESNPNISTETKVKLMTIIESQRDHFRDMQKKAESLKAEDDNYFTVFPGNIVMSLLGRSKFELKIVTSTRTEEAFSVGKDDDTDIYGKKN
jgi:hypothetical protein